MAFASLELIPTTLITCLKLIKVWVERVAKTVHLGMSLHSSQVTSKGGSCHRWQLVENSSHQNVFSGGAGLKGVCSSWSLFAMNFMQNRSNFRLTITARRDLCESAISRAESAYGTAMQCPGVNMATQHGRQASQLSRGSTLRASRLTSGDDSKYEKWRSCQNAWCNL